MSSYRYLGIYIDCSLSFTIDKKARKSKLKHIRKSLWPHWQTNFTGKSQYIIWVSFVESRITYSLTTLAKHSKIMNMWIETYFYTAICSLLNTRLRPKYELLFKVTTGGTS